MIAYSHQPKTNNQKEKIMKKVKWGILSTAKIGTVKVIPAIQKAANSEVVAISSRSYKKAKEEAGKLGIPKVFGS